MWYIYRRKFTSYWSCGEDLYSIIKVKESTSSCHYKMYIESNLACWFNFCLMLVYNFWFWNKVTCRVLLFEFGNECKSWLGIWILCYGWCISLTLWKFCKIFLRKFLQQIMHVFLRNQQCAFSLSKNTSVNKLFAYIDICLIKHLTYNGGWFASLLNIIFSGYYWYNCSSVILAFFWWQNVANARS